VPDPASVGQHMHDAAAEMARRGWRVLVLAAARGYDDAARIYPRRERIDGVDVRRLPLSSFGKASLLHRLVGGGLFLAQATLHALLVRRVRCVLVSTSPPMCGILGWLLSIVKRAPLKFWAMDINPDQLVAVGSIGPRSLPARAFERLNRAVLRRASDVIALDRFMAERLERKLPVAAKTTVIPPWPHIDRVDAVLAHESNPFRRAHGLDGKFVIMYSGNLSPAHPVGTILEAARRLERHRELLFLFIGGGLGRQEIESFVRRHPAAQVRMLPYQPLAELHRSLSAADVHLVTLGERLVGVCHPCKIYGAMAVGRPILLVGPQPSHVSDILEAHPIGWRVGHGDVDGAVACIERMLSTDPASLAAMGARAQQVVAQRFSRARLCPAFCDVLERGARPTAA